MDIRNLTSGSEIYTANAYLCTPGDGHSCSLLIDTGCDNRIITTLIGIGYEKGGLPVRDIFLTHAHYDHSRMIREIKSAWPEVKTYAFSAYIGGIDQVLTGGEEIQSCGTSVEIIHVPGHTTDSVCIYLPKTGILFTGDSPIVIWGTDATYEQAFFRAFERLASLKVSAIYPGHGEPLLQDCNRLLDQSLRNLKQSRII